MVGGIVRTWYQVFFNSEFALQSNTKYHIVCQPHAGGLDVSNYYQWYNESGIKATYKLGNVAFYDAGWTQYPNDNLKFKLCYGGRFDTGGYTQTYSILQHKRYI